MLDNKFRRQAFNDVHENEYTWVLIWVLTAGAVIVLSSVLQTSRKKGSANKNISSLRDAIF